MTIFYAKEKVRKDGILVKSISLEKEKNMKLGLQALDESVLVIVH